jgi:hypothetical protein
MDPRAQLILLILQTLIKYGPEAVTTIIGLLSMKTDPTPEDWNKLLTVVNKPLYNDGVKKG